MQAVPVAILTSLCGALVLTPPLRRIAARTGFLAHPSERGIHRDATPVLGGVAVFVGTLLGLGVSGFFVAPPTRIVGFLGGGALVFAMGVIDDRANLSWFSKLLGQIVAAVFLLASGNIGGAFFQSPMGLVLSLVWVVGLTNALNFLDNMDGICAGIAAVAALTFAAIAAVVGQSEAALLAASLAGAAIGFLRFNFPPGRIFLGDGGSLFLGYALASLGLMTTRNAGFSPTLLIPVIVLAYPIFDMTFVSATRYARGQSLAQGGMDHTSHRLARVTGGAKMTALTIYAICGALGVFALGLLSLDFAPATLIAFLGVLFSFLAFGIRLARRAPVPDRAAAPRPAVS